MEEVDWPGEPAVEAEEDADRAWVRGRGFSTQLREKRVQALGVELDRIDAVLPAVSRDGLKTNCGLFWTQ